MREIHRGPNSTPPTLLLRFLPMRFALRSRSSHQPISSPDPARVLAWSGGLWGLLAVLLAFAWAGRGSLSAVASEGEQLTREQAAERETEWLTGIRQLTFEGLRAGEGYFSRDGRRMVFQSERDPANPFYQIYLMDLETGDIERVSSGHGKTTCAWIHPQGDRVLFASTHQDPTSEAKQRDELQLRETGRQRRYAWDYDEHFELYVKDLNSGEVTRLTDAVGYDAEASFSPDGSKIVFASNREAYSRPLSEREATLFELDPASLVDLYIMNADGSNVQRLTENRGYDGGPFFSADGDRICWRRFSEDGATAEIYTMRTDGSDVRRLTDLGKMSWAPYFHPSGDYLIFTTNLQGFANFELYLVRSDGQGEPVRVTFTDGFDGLPMFLASGDQLTWTSNRAPGNRSQIFLAQWDDAEARRKLGLDPARPPSSSDPLSEDREAALAAADASVLDFTPADAGRHVDYLTRPELGGRLTGTEGERRATAYVAAYLESIGFEPAGDEGTFFHSFDFPAGSVLTEANAMQLSGESLELDRDYRPLAFSGDGKIEASDLVFAGYGLQVPASEGQDEYDSYVHLDVADKWVVAFRDLPQEISPERRQQMARYSTPRRKASFARDQGARGILFVAGPTSQVRERLIRFETAASQANVSIGVLSISDGVAERIFQAAGKDLREVQASLDDGAPQMGFALPGSQVTAEIEIQRIIGTGRNVLARLPASRPSPTADQVVIVGAHIDHLGVGGGTNSLARDDERDQVHVGADDNASGIAAMLEIAQHLAGEQAAGRLVTKRDLIVAAWSGEELGLFGSQAFVSDFYDLYPDALRTPSVESDPHAAALVPHGTAHVADSPAGEQTASLAHGTVTDASPLTSAIAIYLNLDMVGRLREKLVVQGIGSSPQLEGEVRRRNVPVGLELQLDKASRRLPTDAASFVTRDVPILSGFTGAHEDYHTPRDTPEKLNYEGIAKISRLFALLTRGFLVADEAPPFELDEGEREREVPRARLTAYLGTIPDYVAGDVKGLKLSGVAADGPASQAGVRGGDIIVELAGQKIEDIYDYTFAIEALKIGETVEVVVKRGDETVRLKVTPGSRE